MLSHPPRTRMQRALFRAPIWLYRVGLGGLLGSRFVLLTHTGRRSGLARQVVLEVVGRHQASGGYLIASGYGGRSQWFRNILDDPWVRFQVGWRSYAGLARPLPPVESGRRLAEYARSPPHGRGPAAGRRPGRRRVGRRLPTGGVGPRARRPHRRPTAAQWLCGRDRIRTCVGNAGDFTGRSPGSPQVPSCPRLPTTITRDVRK